MTPCTFITISFGLFLVLLFQISYTKCDENQSTGKDKTDDSGVKSDRGSGNDEDGEEDDEDGGEDDEDGGEDDEDGGEGDEDNCEGDCDDDCEGDDCDEGCEGDDCDDDENGDGKSDKEGNKEIEGGAEDSCEIYCYCSKGAQPQCVQQGKAKPKPTPKPEPKPAPKPEPKPAPKPAPKSKPANKPAANPQNNFQDKGNAAAVAAGAAGATVAAAAAGAAVRTAAQKSQPKPKPSPQVKPKSSTAPAPKIPENKKSDKCNYCLRPKCSPGGCSEAPNFDAKKDADALHKAVKGIGTDERVLINILTHRSDEQIEKIRQEYQEFGKGLDKDIADDTSFKTKKLMLALLTPRPEFFADELHHAFSKHDPSPMIMIMASLPPCAIKEVGAAYLRKHKKPLADAIRDSTALNFEKYLVELSTGKRDKDDKVDPTKAAEDADKLIQAGVKNWITDQSTFIDIFSHRSIPQLQEIIKQYKNKRGHDINEDIKKATTDKLQKGLLALVKNVNDQPGYFADELEGSLTPIIGPGIEDNDKLVRIMRGRCGVDLGDITDAYPKNHDNKKLEDRLRKKTYMDYEEALLSMLQQKPGDNSED